ncbi:MAG: response regulator transcription factor [Dehalococcoidales bacterium]|jgi:two-component system response regulator MprA|nr:response regulator transcription factor [Dehalococcoidales bacterium]
MAKILVIEDDSSVADFIKRGLEQNGFDVQVAETGASGLKAALEANPDLVILDLMLPDIDGIDICRQLRDECDTGILILTARALIGERVRGLEAGADDYLPKPFAFEELVARIRAVLRRRSPEATGIIKVADLEIDIERRQVHRGDRLIELTAKEFELLKLLSKTPGIPVSREVIIERVWGYDFEGETDPVKVYITFLRRKLNAEGEPDLILSVRGFGYALRDDQ